MSLAQRDRNCIWHPFTPQKSMGDPIPVVGGKGSLLTDEHGNQYIDAISSWWVTLHGHGHPAIAEAVYRQALALEQVIFAGFTHEPAVALAETLLAILPGNLARVFYSDDGSTSTEVAIKMSLQYWWNQGRPERKNILAFRDAYHGDTFGDMSVSDRSVFTAPFQHWLNHVEFIDLPTAENIQTLKQTIAAQAGSLAAFIFEPLVQGAGGMKMYPAPLLDELMDTCKQHGVICIADEVMTGFGRTGKLFACEYLSAEPDIICLSKGLTGGTLPLGVTACNNRVYQAFVQDDPAKTFFHGHSFTANPLACAAALASLKLLQQVLAQNELERITAFNLLAMAELSRLPQVKNLRMLGTILAFEVNRGPNEYLNSVAQTITRYCLQRGVYIRPLGNTVYWMPPYCITQEELKKVLAVVKECLHHLD